MSAMATRIRISIHFQEIYTICWLFWAHGHIQVLLIHLLYFKGLQDQTTQGSLLPWRQKGLYWSFIHKTTGNFCIKDIMYSCFIFIGIFTSHVVTICYHWGFWPLRPLSLLPLSTVHTHFCDNIIDWIVSEAAIPIMCTFIWPLAALATICTPRYHCGGADGAPSLCQPPRCRGCYWPRHLGS